jgi:hypothetical protein
VKRRRTPTQQQADRLKAARAFTADTLAKAESSLDGFNQLEPHEDDRELVEAKRNETESYVMEFRGYIATVDALINEIENDTERHRPGGQRTADLRQALIDARVLELVASADRDETEPGKLVNYLMGLDAELHNNPVLHREDTVRKAVYRASCRPAYSWCRD